jgi:23S rRNA (pseudouridine1915-N3)-methyltransferase
VRIRKELPRQSLSIVLDERGEQLTTRSLADYLQAWSREAPSATFVIGSADGLDAALKTEAHHRIGLSRLTLPHGLARVLLVEQLYRAVSLLAGHPYHRD